MNRNFLFCNILTVMLFLLTEVPLYAQNNIVHAYTPFTIPATGPSGVAYPSHVRNDVISARFGVKVANVSVPAIRYDNTVNGNQGHNMDVARFASNSLTPKIEINIIGGTEINSVTIHPVRFYPQKALAISADRKTLTFEMVKDLPYAIVIINGDDPQDASTTNPQLTLINDPLEEPAKQPSLSAPMYLISRRFLKTICEKIQIRTQSDRSAALRGALQTLVLMMEDYSPGITKQVGSSHIQAKE